MQPCGHVLKLTLDERLKRSATDLAKGGGTREVELAAQARRLPCEDLSGGAHTLAHGGDTLGTILEDHEGDPTKVSVREIVHHTYKFEGGLHRLVLLLVQKEAARVMQEQQTLLSSRAGKCRLHDNVVVEVVAAAEGKEQSSDPRHHLCHKVEIVDGGKLAKLHTMKQEV